MAGTSSATYGSEGYAWWQEAPSVAHHVPVSNLRPAQPEPAPAPPDALFEPDPAIESVRRTRQHTEHLRTLGIMQSIGHPDADFYENKFLQWVRRTLTSDWALVQAGIDGQARLKWVEICRTLELDKKSTVDLFLLAQQGRPGRSEANEILWFLLSHAGLQQPYRDLSNMCSNRVGRVRYYLDRPGKDHPSWWHSDPWTWSRYDDPRNPSFSPAAVPPGPFKLVTGPKGAPLNPPGLWQPVPMPKDPPPLAPRPKTL